MPERAEIEAVWAEMRHALADARTLANPHDPKVEAYWHERIGLVLDRVRDARGDDEGHPLGYNEAGLEWLEPWCDEHPDGDGQGCVACIGASHDAWMHRAKDAEARLAELEAGPSPQGEDHEASELAKFQEDLTRALNRHGVPAMPSWDAAIDWLAEHAIRSPRRKDHEAGKRAALDAVAELRMHGGPNGGWKDLALGEVVDIAIDAYLSCASPYRDGTVAVEDVTVWLRVRAGRTHGNGASSALYAAARDLRAEFGESNEGGNQ